MYPKRLHLIKRIQSPMALLIIFTLLLVANPVSFSSFATSSTPSAVPRILPSKVYTLAQLAKFNGKAGTKAYVAYKGVVYDTSGVSEFKTGSYKGMKVGTDITSQLRKLSTANALLKKLKPVGSLQVLVPKTTAVPTTTRQVPSTTKPVPTTTKPIPTTTAAPINTTATLFTLESLAKFNGKNGQPAYVAVDGIVYDVSALGAWSGGEHFQGIEAGRDLSDAIKASPHGKAILSRAKVVGSLSK